MSDSDTIVGGDGPLDDDAVIGDDGPAELIAAPRQAGGAKSWVTVLLVVSDTGYWFAEFQAQATNHQALIDACGGGVSVVGMALCSWEFKDVRMLKIPGSRF
jgi:hypothetical protein